MNENEKFLPEMYYSLDNNMSLDKIKRAKDSGDFLVAKVLILDSEQNCLNVYLGNGFYGKIPLDEFTIYPTRRSNGNYSPSVYSLIGKHICVCVEKILENRVILSRKANMLNAFDHFSSLLGKDISCFITSIVPWGTFVDIGQGIHGLIHINNLTLSRINDPSVLGFKKNTFIRAKITSIDSEKYQVSLNHKELFENLAHTLNSGDIVEVTTLSPIDDRESGYFVFLNHNTPALMDPPEGIKIPYGAKVIARVKGVSRKNPNNLQLNFLSFV